MVVQLMADNPGVEIFIQSVLPISNTSQIGGLTNIKIIALNAKLQEIADKHGATYIDVYSAYVLDGEMNPEYTSDGVHLKDKYKYLWLDILEKYIH